jgi:hypothetical protein
LITTDYASLIEGLHDSYNDHALEFLNRVAKVCTDAGFWANEPYDFSDDTYRWSMVVKSSQDDDDSNGIDITLEITEERDYDSKDGFGINFGLDIVHYNGLILGQFHPFNYTDNCWVDARDKPAVSSRWEIMESCDVSTIPDLILGS